MDAFAIILGCPNTKITLGRSQQGFHPSQQEGLAEFLGLQHDGTGGGAPQQSWP